ncbi:MAG: hypothetical protein WBF51_04110 [Candidatus Dormiibacterota bacterium]
MTNWEPGEDIEVWDSVEDFVRAVRGEPTNADRARWGLYRAAVRRHYNTGGTGNDLPAESLDAVEAETAVRPARRQARTRLVGIWRWRSAIVCLVLFVALLLLLNAMWRP